MSNENSNVSISYRAPSYARRHKLGGVVAGGILGVFAAPLFGEKTGPLQHKDSTREVAIRNLEERDPSKTYSLREAESAVQSEEQSVASQRHAAEREHAKKMGAIEIKQTAIGFGAGSGLMGLGLLSEGAFRRRRDKTKPYIGKDTVIKFKNSPASEIVINSDGDSINVTIKNPLPPGSTFRINDVLADALLAATGEAVKVDMKYLDDESTFVNIKIPETAQFTTPRAIMNVLVQKGIVLEKDADVISGVLKGIEAETTLRKIKEAGNKLATAR